MSNPLKNRQPPAPSETVPRIPLIRCNAEQKYQVRFVCLSDWVFGLNLHYAGKSIVCFAPEEPCEHCDKHKKVEWKGYLCATDMRLEKEFLVEITAGVMTEVCRFLELWKTLRGKCITLTREGNIPNGRLQIDLGGPSRMHAPEACPPKFDLPALLKKIYKLPDDAPFFDELKPAEHAPLVTQAIHGNRLDGEAGPQVDPSAVEAVKSELGKFATNGKH